jgi:hypothetical protein
MEAGNKFLKGLKFIQKRMKKPYSPTAESEAV